MTRTTILIMFCSMLAATQVIAQPRGAATKAPPSFSTKPDTAPTTATAKDTPLSDEDVADAIMGDALSGIYHQADEHFHKGEWNHCLNLMVVVEQGDPHNVETYSNSAYLLWSSDRNDQAIEQLKLGIAANPNISYMYDDAGTHYLLHLKDPAGALPYLEKAIQYPCGWTTYHNLAHCYERLGKWDKAVETWRLATKYGDDVRAPALLKQAEAHLAAQSHH